MSNTYWLNGKYIQKEDAYLSPLTHTLHYGLGAFEGVRSYASHTGDSVSIFRLKEHTERLFESAKIINVPINHSMDEVTVKIRMENKKNTVNTYILCLSLKLKLWTSTLISSKHLTYTCQPRN